MRISNPFRYTFRANAPSQMSVYKLWFGKRYLIIKCKALHQSVNQAAVEIDQRLRLGTKGEQDFYLYVIQVIRKNRITMMEVEVLCQPETPLLLLKCEYEHLKNSEGDPNCLNNKECGLLVPKWIPQEDATKFNAFVLSNFIKKGLKNGSRKTSNTKKSTQGKSGRKDARILHTDRRKNKPSAVSKRSSPVKKESKKGRGNKVR